ncbi:thiamine pyrophosphate-dependent enzyme [Natranaerofaba carboxydovora]|uniref:thiamine pyrophosphate-dependent enzyme n=1 Tax=Natranaerofaba carboxydovora TaxID=2742683 RepID=UPI001F13579C|nr:thiamine pyrophosphate-dependent enzyme [Natranaerofaba carboxydovora]UMZ75228.1 2-oxoglutarate oxidoreductase subunit KorB [Natranaerofaba carboxydovora]
MSTVKPPMPKSWYEKTKPHKFCPGCGHGLVLKVLGEAIDELELQDKAVFGCDIGCSLLAWDFFNLDSIQTHHGRTVPVIAGITRVREDLVGIAYMGDGGGYAIGSQHLVNAAMRDEPVTVILVNNANYGMTGGQMAPTTLPSQKTETSPFGRDEELTGSPTKGPEMIATTVKENAYIARGTIADLRKLKKYIKKALLNQIEKKSFSFVEAISSCPTNWRTNAEQTWDFVEREMTKYFDIGEIKKPDEEEK